MKKLLLSTAMAVGLATAAAAAPTYVIDDFTTGPNPFFELLDAHVTIINPVANTVATDGPDAYNFGGLDYVRTLTFTLTQDAHADVSGFSTIEASNGTLKVANAPQLNTTLELVYDISELAAILGASNTINFGVLFSDGDGATFSAFLNGSATPFGTYSQGNCDVPGCSLGPVQANFSLLGSSLNGSGTPGSDVIRFFLSGPAGHDFQIDRIVAQVPEPGALGLLGLGLAGIGFAARRR